MTRGGSNGRLENALMEKAAGTEALRHTLLLLGFVPWKPMNAVVWCSVVTSPS
jgi:hypothetical protein